jgi:hypothetical protein
MPNIFNLSWVAIDEVLVWPLVCVPAVAGRPWRGLGPCGRGERLVGAARALLQKVYPGDAGRSVRLSLRDEVPGHAAFLNAAATRLPCLSPASEMAIRATWFSHQNAASRSHPQGESP